MPQLDPSSFVSQIFWLTITFLSLVFVMSVFIVPRIASIIDERHQKINSDIQKAEKINQKAANILKRYETAIENAKNEIDKKISQEKEQIEAAAELKKAEIGQYLNRQILANETLLKKERAQTLKAVDEISYQTAELILQKLGIQTKKLKNHD